MNQIVFTAWVLLFPAACTTLGAAGVFLLRRRSRPCTQRILCGMAAGIMLAASVWSLLLPAIQRGQTLPLPAWIPSAVGLVLGAVGLLQVEQFAGQLLAGGTGHGGRMVLAVTLHNLPEGMVAGLAAALALTGEPDAISGALALSLGIGLQNIPEGAAVSLPLAHNGRTRSQAFFAGAASGLVEPLGALLAFALAEWGQYCASVAAQRSGGLYGVRDRTGDDPAGRGGRRACRCCKHRAGICADDGTGCGIVRKKGCCKINAVKITG